MTWVAYYCSSCEWGHEEMDFVDRNGMAVQTTRVNTGTYGGLFSNNGAGGHYFDAVNMTAAQANGAINVMSIWAGLNGTPTSDVALVSQSGATTERQVRIGTDLKLRIYDKDENQLGPASASSITTSSLDHIVVIFDSLTLGSNDLWIAVIINGTEELAFRANRTATEFWTTGGSEFVRYGDPTGNHGASSGIFFDDATWRRSGASGDAPQTVGYPKLLGVGGAMRLPIAEGTHSQWSPLGAGTHYTEVDDTAGSPDDDTSYNEETVVDEKDTYQYGTSNPLPAASDVVDFVWHKGRTRLTGASKLGCNGLLRDSGGSEITQIWVAGSTSYSTKRDVEAENDSPDGDPWSTSDWDLTGGESNTEFGVQAHPTTDVGVRLTTMYCPELWSHDSGDLLSTTTTPTTQSLPSRRNYMQPLLVR